MPVNLDFDPDEPEFTLQNPEVLSKYKAAATIAQKALNLLTPHVKPGTKILDLAVAADNFIVQELGKTYAKLKGDGEKGIAFPTCVSVNNIAGNLSPLKDNDTVLNDGDVVKIDLGVHVDGYIVQGGHTVVVGEGAVSGKVADLLAAANTALNVAMRLMRAGKTNNEVTEAIALVAKDYDVTPVEGALGHQLKRYEATGTNSIACRLNADSPKPEEFVFEEYGVYTIDVAFSDGEGKPRQKDARTTVFRRLKMASARQLNTDIAQKFVTLPFTLRAFEDIGKAKLGITELLKHQMLDSFPVTQGKDDEKIVRLTTTVALLPSGVTRLVETTQGASNSEKKPSEALQTLLALPLKRTKKNKKKNNTAATPSTPS